MSEERIFDDRMLTVNDLQKVFNCGQRQAYDLIRIPGFPAMKLGGKYYTSAKALETWIQKNSGRTVFK